MNPRAVCRGRVKARLYRARSRLTRQLRPMRRMPRRLSKRTDRACGSRKLGARAGFRRVVIGTGLSRL
jgi:hypothetical protein